MKNNPLSIIIPARNEGEDVRSTVQSVLENTEGVTQIIVVDDGSSDGCCEGLPEGVRVERLSYGGGAAWARNWGAGVSKQTEGYLVFLDAHTSVSPGWIREMLSGFEAGVAAVGPAIHVNGNYEVWGCGASLKQWEPPAVWEWGYPEETQCVGMVPGGCQMWDARAYYATGGYCSEYNPIGGEDLEVTLRAWLIGYDLIAVPTAHVTHLFKTAPYPENKAAQILANNLRTSILHLALPQLLTVYGRIAWWSPDLLAEVWRNAHSRNTMRLKAIADAKKTRTIYDWFDKFSSENPLAGIGR